MSQIVPGMVEGMCGLQQATANCMWPLCFKTEESLIVQISFILGPCF